MALDIILDNLDNLSDEMKGHYRPSNVDTDKVEGKYILEGLSNNLGFAIENVKGLKSAHSASGEENRTLKANLAKFSFQDGDNTLSTPEQLSEALSELANLRTSTKGGDAEAIRKELSENLQKQYATKEETMTLKFKDELDSSTAKFDSLSSQLSRTILDNDLRKALEANGGDARTYKLLRGALLEETKVSGVTDEDGTFKLDYKVVDSSGVPRITTQAGRFEEGMSLTELVAEYKANPDYAPLFGVEEQGGTGHKPNRGGGSAIDTSKMTGSAKMAAGRRQNKNKR